MHDFDREQWDALMDDAGEEPRLSIYLRTRRTGREVRQNTIRLKNALQEADAQLAERGLDDRERTAFLAPLQELLDQGETWSARQLDGAALFLSPAGLRQYRFGHRFRELCLVGDRFHLKPLLPLLVEDEVFHVLALSLNQVHLFRADGDQLTSEDLGEIPGSLEEALGHELTEPHLKQHAGSRPGPRGGRDLIFHGHGDVADSRNEDIERFFHRVDEGLVRRFGKDRPPVVLAGVDEHLHRFRKLSKYPALVDGGVTGNADSLDRETVLREAWAQMRPRLESGRREAAEAYRELQGSGRTLDDLPGVLEAARVGRVDRLLVSDEQEVWGQFPESGEAEIHAERQAGDEELLDRAAVLSFAQGAPVFVCSGEEMPTDAEVAAVLRY